jgi:uncharacterized protein (TIGR03435 family)
MRRRIFIAAFLVLLPPCDGQGEIQFEVASIKPAPLQPIGRTSVHTSSNRSSGDLTYSNVNLKDLIEQAFKLKQYQINAPAWTNDTRFDIVAKFTPGSTPEQFEQMLQSLLDDRFHLKFHRETQELPVYALAVVKGGPKLKATEESGSSSSNSNGGRVHLEAKITLARFAEYLSQRTDRPVLDRTGLPGSYEIVLDYAAGDSLAANIDGTVPSLFTAIQEQLGLKLEATKGSIEFLVVDSAEKIPTEN